MGEKSYIRGRGTARLRAAASLLLLFLTAHAFFASATHFHRISRADAGPAQAALLSREGSGQSAPLGGDDAQCLLCRLQRSFASGVQHALPSVASPQAEAPGYEPLRNVTARVACSLLRPGRAPPHA